MLVAVLGAVAVSAVPQGVPGGRLYSTPLDEQYRRARVSFANLLWTNEATFSITDASIIRTQDHPVPMPGMVSEQLRMLVEVQVRTHGVDVAGLPIVTVTPESGLPYQVYPYVKQPDGGRAHPRPAEKNVPPNQRVRVEYYSMVMQNPQREGFPTKKPPQRVEIRWPGRETYIQSRPLSMPPIRG